LEAGSPSFREREASRQTYQLPGAPDEQVGGPAFNTVRDALLRDSEQLPLCGPIQPTREFLRMLERKQLVLDRVDADGTVHPQVIEGDTPAGWQVWDWIRREFNR